MTIEFPPRIAALKRTDRGIPIPYFAAYIDGKPDLRFADHNKPPICARKRLCWVCGQSLERTIAFVGGPQCSAIGRFTDGPMHRECAEFSLRHCPFLAVPNLFYSTRNLPVDAETPTNMTTVKPDKFGLTLCEGFNIQRISDKEIHFLATLIQSVTFWRDGLPL